MQLLLSPLTIVTILIVDPKGSQSENPRTTCAVIQQVQPGCISISEADSSNGLGKIICTAESGTKGSYWYEYIDTKGKPKSYNVVVLNDAAGNVLNLASFIK